MPSLEVSPPLYRQIALHYADLIASGKLVAGDKISSEREIMSEWSVSKATANKVVAALKAEGLVYAKVGVGAIVTNQASQKTASISPSAMLARARHRGAIRIASEETIRTAEQVSFTDAPEKVQEILSQAETVSNLICRRRVVLRDQQPYAVMVSWIPTEGLSKQTIRRLLDVKTSIAGGTPGLLARELGVALSHATDLITSITANQHVAQDLNLEDGSTVLYGITSICADGEPIEVGEYFYPAGTFVTYSYEI